MGELSFPALAPGAYYPGRYSLVYTVAAAVSRKGKVLLRELSKLTFS